MSRVTFHVISSKTLLNALQRRAWRAAFKSHFDWLSSNIRHRLHHTYKMRRMDLMQLSKDSGYSVSTICDYLSGVNNKPPSFNFISKMVELIL